jgi:hypothetical protein
MAGYAAGYGVPLVPPALRNTHGGFQLLSANTPFRSLRLVRSILHPTPSNSITVSVTFPKRHEVPFHGFEKATTLSLAFSK